MTTTINGNTTGDRSANIPGNTSPGTSNNTVNNTVDTMIAKMIQTIKPREATAIMNSLTAGVVPRTGIQHITVGRPREIEALLKSFEEVNAGHSIMKFWIIILTLKSLFRLPICRMIRMRWRQ